MPGDVLAAEAVHVVERSGKADRLHDGRRTCLKPVRRLGVGDDILGHIGDHLAAAAERAQPLQRFRLAIEHADAGRAVDLVAGQHIVVAVHVAHIDGHVHGSLTAIHQHLDAARMGDAADVLHRHHGAQHVGHLGDGDKLGTLAQCRLEGLQIEGAILAHIDPLQHRAIALAVEVPGHDVGVVLHDRQDDLIARAERVRAKTVGHEIDGLGRGAGEDDLVHRPRIEEAAHGLARGFVILRCRVGEEMQAPVHVGIFLRIGLHHGIDDRLRLLRRSAIVQIDERLAVDFPRQDREITAHGGNVIAGGRGSSSLAGGHHSLQSTAAYGQPAIASHSRTRVSSSSVTLSLPNSSMASDRKARTSRVRASASGMPRARR